MLDGERLAAFDVLGGGKANTNIRLQCAGARPDLVLRLYQRDPGQRYKEVALCERLRDHVPVPEILAHGDRAPGIREPYMLMGFIEGHPIEQEFADLDADARQALGQSLGATLAGIHSHVYEAPGFLDGDLNVATPLPDGGEGISSVLQWLLDEGDAAARLGSQRCRALVDHVGSRRQSLSDWPGLSHLVHGDFGFSNILMTGQGNDVAVAAVLDWEFALAATPLLDLGNLIRPPAGDDPAFLEAVAQGYRTLDHDLPENWADLARAVDLMAWVDFAGRPDAPDGLLDHARAMIDRIVA